MSVAVDLDRFVTAQADSFDHAARELEQGRKQSHWMWFVFPQIAGLGRSATAQRYAIRDLAEARAYLAHPVLGPRLVQSARLAVAWAGRRSARDVFGEIDAVKLRSSATLFEAAGGDAIFGKVIDAYFGGERDLVTLDLIGRPIRGL